MNIFTYACFFIGICQGSFNLELKKNLNFESQVEFNRNYINSLEVKDPPGTWVELLTTSKICLFYKTPYKKNFGVLKITKAKSAKCDEISETPYMKDNISSLSVSFDDKNLNLILNIDEEKLVVVLLNFVSKKKYKKYSSNIEEYKIDSLAINEDSIKSNLSDGQLCHGVNSNCVSIVENTCAKCPSGFHEVVDYNCPQGGSKYCGLINCGQKDRPACPRGYEILETKLSSLCFDGSPAGYCAPGLKTFCNDDKVLICL